MNRNTTTNKNANLNNSRNANAPGEAGHQNKTGLIYWTNPSKSGASFAATLVNRIHGVVHEFCGGAFYKGAI
ncbi:ASN_collapsed_G0007220.mRNA.1.CDS.1 [Saccharomyces cerevisiae]|nr:ASN_collapsed_G0007220.mRNA.1.CDS.1 [Saccharomyces cerevisiae]